MRERKHDMHVRHVEDLPLPCRQPGRLGGPMALWAVPIAAGVIRLLFVPTMVALGDMSAQGGRATRRDGAQGPVLRARQGRPIPCQEGVAILLHDVRDFECRARHGRDTVRTRLLYLPSIPSAPSSTH